MSKFRNGVEKCSFEWHQEPKRKFRPLKHVCALESDHKNRHVCMCGVGKLKARRASQETK